MASAIDAATIVHIHRAAQETVAERMLADGEKFHNTVTTGITGTVKSWKDAGNQCADVVVRDTWRIRGGLTLVDLVEKGKLGTKMSESFSLIISYSRMKWATTIVYTFL